MDKYKEALQYVTGDRWIEGAADSRSKEHALQTLVSHSKKQYFRDEFQRNEELVKRMADSLRDQDTYMNVSTVLILRIFRNACGRHSANQKICADAEADVSILNMISTLLNVDTRNTDELDLPSRRIQTVNLRLRQEYLLYSLQFLCNFTTANKVTASRVWNRIFPELLQELLGTLDDNTFAATAALAHNCIACIPETMFKVVTEWDGEHVRIREEYLSSPHVKKPSAPPAPDKNGLDNSVWIITIARLSISAGNLLSLFDATLNESVSSLTEATKFIVAVEKAILEMSQVGSSSSKKAWFRNVDNASISGLVDIVNRFIDDPAIASMGLHCLSMLFEGGPFEGGMKLKTKDTLLSDLKGLTVPALMYQLRSTDYDPLKKAILRFMASLVDAGYSAPLKINVDADTVKALVQELQSKDVDGSKWSAKTIGQMADLNERNRKLFVDVTISEKISQEVLSQKGLDVLVEKTHRKLQF